MNYDTLDADHRHSAFSPVCSYCTRLQDIGKHVCEAFPNGIPDEIWKGENDHIKPYNGDMGLLFERRKPRL